MSHLPLLLFPARRLHPPAQPPGSPGHGGVTFASIQCKFDHGLDFHKGTSCPQMALLPVTLGSGVSTQLCMRVCVCVCVCIGGIISPLRLCGARKDSTEENLPENVPKGTVELLPMRVPLGGSLQLSSRELEQGSSFPRKSFKGLAKVILIRSKRESIFKNEGARTKVQRQVSVICQPQN